jgi:hypothetical protein
MLACSECIGYLDGALCLGVGLCHTMSRKSTRSCAAMLRYVSYAEYGTIRHDKMHFDQRGILCHDDLNCIPRVSVRPSICTLWNDKPSTRCSKFKSQLWS